MNSLKPFFNKDQSEAGCDEAGRGCLAGPVVAAAVILPGNFNYRGLNDSKQLSKKQRDLLKVIIKNEAVSWAIGICDQKEIDRFNILKASIIAMHRAIEKLSINPGHLIIDGNKFYPYKEIPFKCIVKGDSKYYSIAAASILAKTYRDEYMEKIHLEHPEFNWEKNMGYPTKEHKNAIIEHGITKYHRRSFKLFPDQLKIDF